MKQSDTKFTGFTPETFQFFNDLEENNYKPWFDEHKPIYESEVLLPLKAFAAAMTPSFYAVDPKMDLRPNKMISRIYRDIRFSKDKTPYKKQIWVMFQRPFTKATDEWTLFPGYYFEIGKGGAGYGMGLFEGKKKIMDAYREQVEYDPDYFEQITNGLLEKKGFQLGGEAYKRPLKNDLPEKLQPWIQKKGVYLYKQLPVSEMLFSSRLIEFMEKEFSNLHPLYDFFVDICD